MGSKARVCEIESIIVSKVDTLEICKRNLFIFNY